MASPNQLSFLPDDYLERKAQRRTNVICAGLFIVVMIAIGSAFSITERSMKQIEAQHVAVEQEYTEAAKRIEQVQRMQDKQRTMAHQAELTASLLEKVPRSFLLADITNSMPSGVSLLDFTMDTRTEMIPVKQEKKNTISAPDPANPPPPPQMQRVSNVTMKMTGIAGTDVQVAQFITKLNQSRLLKDVNLLISDEHVQDGEKMRRFQIEATLDPKAEITPSEKAAAATPTRTVSVELEER